MSRVNERIAETTAGTTAPLARGADLAGLAAWVVGTFAAAAAGTIASSGSREFYGTLERSQGAPSGSVFGPVWTVLYLMMAIAAWLVWRKRTAAGSAAAASRRTGLALYVAQLVLNALWTWIFFGLRNGAWAFGEIILLWVAILATMMLFARVRTRAALLLLPYIAWVTFAAALPWDVWRRNPTLL